MVLIPIDNDYRTAIGRIIGKLQIMVEPHFFPMFKYDHKICAILVEEGYVTNEGVNGYWPTYKGRKLKKILTGDPLQRLVLLGQAAPTITKIVNEWAQEQAEKDDIKVERRD